MHNFLGVLYLVPQPKSEFFAQEYMWQIKIWPAAAALMSLLSFILLIRARKNHVHVSMIDGHRMTVGTNISFFLNSKGL